MKTDTLLLSFYPLRPFLLGYLRRRWPDAGDDRREDAISNLWIELLRHPERYAALSEEARLPYCKKVVQRAMRSHWRGSQKEEAFSEELGEELRGEEVDLELRMDAERGRRKFRRALPAAAQATCRRHAKTLERAVIDHVEGGVPATELADRYQLSREYISIVMRHVRASMVA